MEGRLKGPQTKIDRAKKHISDLEAALGALTFSNSTHPNVILIDEDREPGKHVYKVGPVPCVPDEIAAIAGDAIHNLRSCLDLFFIELIKKGWQQSRVP